MGTDQELSLHTREIYYEWQREGEGGLPWWNARAFGLGHSGIKMVRGRPNFIKIGVA